MTDDRSGDTSDDMSGDGRWMTYDELAKLRGIARASAERLVQRNHWRRQRGNDRTVRILVPMDSLLGDMSDDLSPHVSDDVSADTRALLARGLAALEDAVAALRQQSEAAKARAADAEVRADRAEAAIDAERARADALRDRVTAMREQLADAHAALQAAAAAESRTERAEQDKQRAEASLTAERARADALRDRLDSLQHDLMASEALASELRAGQAMMTEMHAHELPRPSTTLRQDSRRLRSCVRPRPSGRRGGCWHGSRRRGGGSRLPTRKCAFELCHRGLTSRYVHFVDLRAVARPGRGCPARRRRDERPASKAPDAADGHRLREAGGTRYGPGAIGSATRGGAS
jgi:hypothetical protein